MTRRNQQARRTNRTAARNQRRNSDNDDAAPCKFLGLIVGGVFFMGTRLFLDQASEDNMDGTLTPIEILGLFLLSVFFILSCISGLAMAGDESGDQQHGNSYSLSDDLESQPQSVLRRPLLSDSVDDVVERELERYAQARELMEQSNGAVASFLEALRIVEERNEVGSETASSLSLEAGDITPADPTEEARPSETHVAETVVSLPQDDETKLPASRDKTTTTEVESEIDRH